MDVEMWVPVGNFPRYMVSNHGRVKNIDENGRRHRGQEMTDDGFFVSQSRNKKGYMVCHLYKPDQKALVTVHRLVAQHFVPNPDELPYVDHIDMNPVNNHVSNLRWCTNSQNMRNTRPLANSTSRFKGVCWDKSRSKWRAQIKIDGKHRNLGQFENEEDAARAYDTAARELHGEFARLNFS